jgi:hypothetical protein
MTQHVDYGAWALPPSGVPSRNKAIGLAERTRRNLDFILAAHGQGADVHVVTQVVLSLLGIVMFPLARVDPKTRPTWDAPLVYLAAEGWPAWTIEYTHRPVRRLYHLIRGIRNATAHGDIKFSGDSAFSSDSRFLHEVTIEFVHYYDGRPQFLASISGPDLLDFCRRFLDRIAQYGE